MNNGVHLFRNAFDPIKFLKNAPYGLLFSWEGGGIYGIGAVQDGFFQIVGLHLDSLDPVGGARSPIIQQFI